MKLAGRAVLESLNSSHADARTWISSWIKEIEGAMWASPHELKARFPSASFLPGGIVIFNAKGNRYRIETRISFKAAVVMVTWAGTHAEYSKRS
jgi:mRNA interferase HigB